ncbi:MULTISPECIES: cache domain-containing protein [unclassified Fusibacter]|uniref:cache domain-containing protein n=1 Tax=unclassified Fusibacter TaxID=2624464 RepID=UPI001011C1D2|nr:MULTISPECIES: cache domain-containing protein [unclassified Fusibacter]MCK8058362.1 cache domain-containing protein [Fusibacter sp. A2]NPE20945.1 cache domain-containing protein [Fusibacter sp. A1]RXV63147.1 hypothetical protein DWB64_03845 [Fusibacter sp. A1]
MKYNYCPQCGNPLTENTTDGKGSFCVYCQKRFSITTIEPVKEEVKTANKKRSSMSSKSVVGIIALLISLMFLVSGLLSFFFYQNNIQQEQVYSETLSELEQIAASVSDQFKEIDLEANQLASRLSLLEYEAEGENSLIHEQLDMSIKKQADIQYAYIGYEDKSFVMEPVEELPDGYDPTSRPWYKTAAEQKRSIWAPIYFDASSSNIICTLAVPVYTDSNQSQLKGVMGYDLNVSSLLSNLETVNFFESDYLMVVDQEGTIVMHPSDDLIGMPLHVPELMEASKDNQSQIIKSNFEGKKNTVFITTIEEMNWHILCILPK